MKYNIGMYGGSFNPLHLGHVNDIIRASNVCDKLYLVLSVSNDEKEIDYRERLMWLKSITNHMDNVEVFTIFDNNQDKETYDWLNGVNQIKSYINKPIDVVFAGSDYKNKNIWEKLYPESTIHYFDRNEIPISSTEIRNNPFKYYDYLPHIVQRHYIKKVCVIGTESCGKTTLIKNLASFFNTTYVEEAGKYVCIDAGGIDNMQKKHYFDILFKQKELERNALENANKVLLIDTDSLITLFYYNLGFDTKTKEDDYFRNIAENIGKLNNYDLYIFLEPDVNFVYDITRRTVEENVRYENNKILKQLFDNMGIKYITINGTYEERYEKSKEKVLKLIKE